MGMSACISSCLGYHRLGRHSKKESNLFSPTFAHNPTLPTSRMATRFLPDACWSEGCLAYSRRHGRRLGHGVSRRRLEPAASHRTRRTHVIPAQAGI